MSRTAHFFTKTNITIAGGLLVLLAAPIVFWQTRHNDPAPQPAPAAVSVQPAETTSLTYQGEDGKTALELLKTHAQVESKSSSLGDYVTSINGNDGGGTKYWMFYVDGKEAAEGAGTYQTHTGEKVEWKLQ